MKTGTIQFLKCAVLVWALPFLATGQNNPCVDSISWGPWACIQQGANNTVGTLDTTTFNICVGDSVTPPTFTVNPTWINGLKRAFATHTCLTHLNGYVTNTVVYTSSSLYFVPDNAGWPAITGPFNTPGTYTYKAKVDGLPIGGVCSTITGVIVATVTVNVRTPPSISVQPVSQTVGVGANVTFSATASGSAPLSYQWFFNSNTIPSATGASLFLSNVQLTNAGVYAVLVSNLCGTLMSSNAILTVTGGCVSLPGMVGWWNAQSNLLDSVSTNHGNAPVGIAYASGKVGHAFSLNGINQHLRVPASSNLNVGVSNGFTIETWINPYNINFQPIAEWNNNVGGIGVHLWLSVGPSGNLYANLVDTSGINHVISSAGGMITASNFQHVALTYNKTTGVAVLYRNGVGVVTNTLGSFTPRTTAGLYFGLRPSGPSSGIYFKGLIDEPAVYNRTLSAAEIQSIYNAGGNGKCPLGPTILVQPASRTVTYGQQEPTFSVVAAGTPALKYQWKRDGTNIPGATSSSYTVPQPVVADSGKSYSVIVSNAYGSVTSSSAVLTVLKAPLTIIADHKAKVYGKTNPPLTWSATGFVYNETTNVLSGAPQLSTTATTGSGAGAYLIAITVGTLSAANYSFVTDSGLLTVAKAPLTFTPVPKGRTYGSANPPFTWTTNGFVNGDPPTVVSGTPVFTTTATVKSGVGTYPIVGSPGTLSATNYFFVFPTGTLTVHKATIAVVAQSTNRVYGAPNPPLIANYFGFVAGDNAAVLGGAPTISTTATTNSPVSGSYPISVTQGSLTAANYFFVFFNGQLTITKAPLSVIADHKAKHAGESNPPLTYSFNGFVAGDTAGAVSGAPVLTTSATAGSPVGSYVITNAPGTLSAANYTFTLQNGLLNVLQPSSELTLSNAVMNYLIGSPPTVIDSNITVAPKGNATFNNSQLTAAFLSSQPGDRLSVRNLGPGSEVNVTNTSSGPDPYVIQVGMTNIATFTPGSPTNALVIRFNSNATPGRVQAVARNMTYYNVSASPSESLRQVKCHVTVSNVIGGLTNSLPVTNTIVPACPTNIYTVLIIDRTTSMGSTDVATTNIFGSNRLAVAKNAAVTFLNYPEFPTDHVWVMSFCGNPGTTTNPTMVTTNFLNSRAALSNAIAGINSMCTATVYPPSLRAAFTNLVGITNDHTLRLIIFLTDGEQNGSSSNWQLALNEAQSNRLAGIRLVTIGLGGGIDNNTTQGANARTLLRLMASSPEDFHISTNGTGLTTVYQNIATSVCRYTNLPPVVNAGPDTTNIFNYNTLPGIVPLNGSAYDPDGLPLPPQLTNQWSLLAGGPTNSIFISNRSALNTTATFPLPGTYPLQLLASDTDASVTDQVLITVRERPTVTITNPVNGATFNRLANVLIQASAASRDGGVSKVEFFAGGVRLGADSNSPFALTWSNVLSGIHSLTAVATDVHGLTATSPPVSITVFGPPTVFIRTPANNQVFVAPANVQVTAIAEDMDNVVTNVDYYLNGSFWSRLASSPYPRTLSNTLAGTYQFRAVAINNKGLMATSPPVNITVLPQPPVVTIVAPKSNSVFALGEPIPIQAVASDADGVVTNVQFRAGTFSIGNDPSFPYAMNWTSAVAGSTNLIAVARDNDGLSGTSAPVNITIQGCIVPGVSNVILSVSQVNGGLPLTGMVILSNTATTGGQAVNLYSSSPLVIVPPSVFVPSGQRSNSFVISTLPVLSPLGATISASYHSQPVKTANLTVNPNAGGATNTAQICGPMDVAVLLDTSGSMVSTINAIISSLSGVLNNVEIASGGDYRLSLITFGDSIHVDVPFSLTNRAVFQEALINWLSRGDIEYSHEAIYSAVHGLSEGVHNGVYQFGNFAPFRSSAKKIIVLFTDELPGAFVSGVDDVKAHLYAEQARASNVLISAVNVKPFSLGLTYAETKRMIMEDYSDTTGGIYVESETGSDAGAALEGVIAQCGAGEGRAVFVRSDLVQEYASSSITGPQLGAAGGTASFDTRGIWGEVSGARFLREGVFQGTPGSRFDVELGIGSLVSASSSFGLLFTNAHRLTNAVLYSREWDLPETFYADAEAQLQGEYLLLLTNRASSVCGQTYSATDSPHAGFPLDRNTLTLAVVTDRVIPQGRVRDFVLGPGNSPQNGTWDVLFRGRVVGSSGAANGWDVEPDYTAFGGFTITVPTNAEPDRGYEVRVQQPGWPEGRSTRFSVVPAASIASAPVLLPIRVSTNMVGASTNITMTIELDAPAPAGAAHVTLNTNGLGGCVVPAWVVIPTGQRSITTNIQINGGTAGKLEITASYNGYRKAAVRVITSACPSLTAPQDLYGYAGYPVDSGIFLEWTPIANASGYNVSRSTNGTTFSRIFSGLATNNFVDLDVVPPTTYYYRITATTNWCEGPASPIEITMTYEGRTPAPWIIPGGGTYNDSVAVLITNYVADTVIYYTTNNSDPVVGVSPSFNNGGILVLSSNAVVKAVAWHPFYSQTSRIVSADFVVIKPASINCNSSVSGSLTTSNAYSIVDGPGYYGSRYIFSGTKGHEVDLTITSATFNTILYLVEPSGLIVAANDDLSPSNSNSRIVFTLRTNGVHTVEVTSLEVEEVGSFGLSLTCIQRPSIKAFTNGVALENYDVLDFGTITGGTKIVSLVISNLGLAALNLTNIAVYPTNFFSVTPSAVSSIAPGARTNLPVQFKGNLPGLWNGLLVITNNDIRENPFYVNLRGRIVPPAGPPQVDLIFPTNGTSIPFSPVDIQLYATAADADGITNVAFYRVGVPTPLGNRTNPPYTIIWSNVISGAYTLEARAWDGAGNSKTSTPVSIIVGKPRITLMPTNICIGLSNTTHIVTAAVTNASGTAGAGTNVTFIVTGANPTNATIQAVAGGIATFTYTGRNPGLDSISVSATVAGEVITAGPIHKAWARNLACGQQISGSLATTDALALGCNCGPPSRHADAYRIIGVAGETVRFTMTSSNFATFMFLTDTNCSPHTAAIEALNATDTRMQFTFPTNGTYVLEASSFEVFKTGGYTLRLDCGPDSGPDIAVRVSGTNAPNFTTLNLGATTNGLTLSQIITITNQGTAPLNITGHFFTLSNVFSINQSPQSQIDPGNGSSFTILFTTTNSGQYTGSLVLASDDPDENPFVLHLTAISNPDGAPPSVAITSPAGGSRFVLPGDIAITALASANGAGVTITNVDFGYRTAQGTFLIGADPIPPFSVTWAPAQPGSYALLARAWDSLGRVAISEVVTVEFHPSTQNHNPIAGTDEPSVLANSVNNVIDVLANDSDEDHDPLIIVEIAPPTSPGTHGTAEIISNGKAIRYTPPPNVRGYPADGFSYKISDGKGGFAWGGVLVTVDASDAPQVEIISPEYGYQTNAGFEVPILAQVTPSANIVKVEFYQGSAKIGEVTNGVNGIYTFNWIADTEECDCLFTATAYDKFGQIGTSSGIKINVEARHGAIAPIAAFDNLQPEVQDFDGFEVASMPTIREGLFDLYGRAYHPQGSNVVWNLQVHDTEGNLRRDFTPPPLNQTGFHPGAVGPGTTSNLLATCDFTTLENGTYDITLTVRGGFMAARTTVRFRLDADLKIGRYTFTERDMVIPVNGIPLVVTRTYDSFNPKRGDFGYSWSYNVTDIAIELDEVRSPAEDVFGRDFSLRTGGGRNMTLTLPGGRRATFAFYWEQVQCNQGDRASLCLEPRWQAPPGLDIKLEVIGKHQYAAIIDRWVQNATTSFEWYEFPGWILTLEDGTKFVIERKKQGEFFLLHPPDQPLTAGNNFAIPYDPPYLSRIIQPTLDTIEIHRDVFGRSSRIQHRDAQGNPTRSVRFERDNEGRIVAITDPAGQNANGDPTGHAAVKYEYDASGNLAKVMKLVNRAAGTYITNRYFYEHSQFPHYLTKILDARGFPVARNLYDDLGRLIGVIDANGRTNRFEHDVTGRREVQYDRLGNATVYQYDHNGRVVGMISPLGHPSSFEYDENGYLSEITDPLGRITTLTHDASGNRLSVTVPHPEGADPARYTVRKTYDAQGNQTSVIYPSGGMETNVFDSRGLFLESRDENGKLIERLTYHPSGQVATHEDRLGTVLSFGYDLFGNLTNINGGDGSAFASGYDANGNITNLSVAGLAGNIQYDAQNRQTFVNADGRTAEFVTGADPVWTKMNSPAIGNLERGIDEQGRLSRVVYPNGTTAGFAYDAAGNIQYRTNNVGRVTEFTYDPSGRATTVKDLTTGAQRTSVFDPAGRLSLDRDALGNSIHYHYYPDDSLAAMTNELGNVWTYFYSSAASCCGGDNAAVIETDPLGRQRQQINSPHGLPLQTIFRSGLNAVTNSLTYWTKGDSALGQPEDYIETMTDEGGNTRFYSYNDFGQLIRASDLSGLLFWTNRYDDDSGALTNVLSPTGESTSYTYEGDELVKTIRFPDGNYLTNYYNDIGQLSSNTLPGGVRVSYRYDETRRLTNWTSSIGENYSYKYNNLDQLVSSSDGAGLFASTNLYDAAGRVYGVDSPNGAMIRYSYDLLDRITNVVARAAAGAPFHTNTYYFDPAGNLTNAISWIDGDKYSTVFEYDRVNRKTKRVLPNGVVTTYEYDWRDRVTNITHSAAGTILARVTYQRSGVGQPTKITRENGSYVVLQYDASLRLTNEVFFNASGVPQSTNSYAYDASGSRIRFADATGTYTNAIRSGFQVTHVTNAATATLAAFYRYDSGGRMLTVSNLNRNLEIRYNSKDQVAVITNGSFRTQYSYDPAGRRVQASDNNGAVVRRFVMAESIEGGLDSPMFVTDGSGVLQQGYVYIEDMPLLRFDSAGNLTYYLEDGMGSVIGLAPHANPTTSTTTRLFYDGFGKTLATNGPAPSIPAGAGGDFRFQGAWLEAATDLYHMRARDYDYRSARFISRDPGEGDFRMPETLNPYAFANNNPYLYADPTGEFSMTEITVAGAINFILQTLKTVAVAEVKARAIEAITDAITQILLNQLPHFGIPIEFTKVERWVAGRDPMELGNLAELAIWEGMCWLLKQTGAEWPKAMHHGVRVADSRNRSNRAIVGKPISRGRNCKEENPWPGKLRLGSVRYALPDLIFGAQPPLVPLGMGQPNKMELDGEVKLRATTLFADYFIPGKKKYQLHAILAYAGRWTNWRVSMFIVGEENAKLRFVDRKIKQADEAVILAQGLKRGVLSLYVPIKGLPEPK